MQERSHTRRSTSGTLGISFVFIDQNYNNYPLDELKRQAQGPLTPQEV
jgi:hypothetical protein